MFVERDGLRDLAQRVDDSCGFIGREHARVLQRTRPRDRAFDIRSEQLMIEREGVVELLQQLRWPRLETTSPQLANRHRAACFSTAIGDKRFRPRSGRPKSRMKPAESVTL